MTMRNTRQSSKSSSSKFNAALGEDFDERDQEEGDGEVDYSDRDRSRSERQLRARRLIESMADERRMRHLAGDDWWDELDR